MGVRVPRWRDGLAVMGHAEGVAALGRLLALFGDADGNCDGTAGTGPLDRGVVRQSSQSPAAQYCGMSQLPSHEYAHGSPAQAAALSGAEPDGGKMHRRERGP